MIETAPRQSKGKAGPAFAGRQVATYPTAQQCSNAHAPKIQNDFFSNLEIQRFREYNKQKTAAIKNDNCGLKNINYKLLIMHSAHLA
jgi:hypothetical protein